MKEILIAKEGGDLRGVPRCAGSADVLVQMVRTLQERGATGASRR